MLVRSARKASATGERGWVAVMGAPSCRVVVGDHPQDGQAVAAGQLFGQLDRVVQGLHAEDPADRQEQSDHRRQERVLQHLGADRADGGGGRLDLGDARDGLGLGEAHLLVGLQQGRIDGAVLGELVVQAVLLGPDGLGGGQGGQPLHLGVQVGQLLLERFLGGGKARDLVGLDLLGEDLGQRVGQAGGQGRVGRVDRDEDELGVAHRGDGDGLLQLLQRLGAPGPFGGLLQHRLGGEHLRVGAGQHLAGGDGGIVGGAVGRGFVDPQGGGGLVDAGLPAADDEGREPRQQGGQADQPGPAPQQVGVLAQVERVVWL